MPFKPYFQLLSMLTLCLRLAAQASAQADADRLQPKPVPFIGSVIDADTKQPIATRVYLQDAEGDWLFVRSVSELGTAWPYSEEWVPMPKSVERHTTVSAHPFMATLSPGDYQVIIERGKEYLPVHEILTITDEPIEKTFLLQRWSHLAAQGWYSGETHVHRRIAELPNVMSAEELNVVFPVTFWTTASDKAPDLKPSGLRSQGPSPFGPREDLGYDPIWLNSHQVILPRNTEYEIFSIGPRRHTLGALFILNHQTPFSQTVPPVGPIVQQARREGALLDLDKHHWPWSLMLVPVAQVDLFELSNNSVWRTNFGFKRVDQTLPPWKEFEHESPGVLTEWGWLEYGFELYYALLNCGFRLSPSAGTASGVHPVPLGYSRVYVNTGNEFHLDAWLDGLKSGRSFVTTGPMLTARVDGQFSGEVFSVGRNHSGEFTWEAEVVSPDHISRVEVIVNGEVKHSVIPEVLRTEQGAWKWSGKGVIDIGGDGNRNDEQRADIRSAWAAIRTWSDQPDGRRRFAHTGAWYFEVDEQPVYPPRHQIDYLVAEIESSLEKQRGILSPDALSEFENAENAYRKIQATAYADPVTQRRTIDSEDEERFWLESMAIWHQYSLMEMSQVLGKPPEKVRDLITRYNVHQVEPLEVRPRNRMAIMPYPGGRHPRRGFLEGAIAPQRETKFSLFTPWSAKSYIVADVPEAVFSNLGLIYLAHTHIPTLWDLSGERSPVQEWQRLADGVLKSRRDLPNGIRVDVTVVPNMDHVRMELALFNGTTEMLTDLRVQHCMMLAQADEFDAGSNDNKIFHGDYALVHNRDRTRWLITSWKPLGRAWGNPPVPCLHADPILPDCPPGATTKTQGWISFFEGEDWQSEIVRLEGLQWWE